MAEGFALFDGEAASKSVKRMVHLDFNKSPEHLSVGLALALQFDSQSIAEDPSELLERIDASAHREKLHEESAAFIEDFLMDPLAFAQTKSGRESMIDYVLGDAHDGVVYEELYASQKSQAVLQEVTTRLVHTLDVGSTFSLEEMRAPLAGLGLLMVMKKAFFPLENVQVWEAKYQEADAAQKNDRAFWDIYRRRVRLAFKAIRRRAG